jgi:hypothetical protein
MRTRKRALEESTADKNIKRQFDEHKESDATTTSSILIPNC